MSGTNANGASDAMQASAAAGVTTSRMQPSGQVVPSAATSHDAPSSVAFPVHLRERDSAKGKAV